MRAQFRRTAQRMQITTKLTEFLIRDFQIKILSSNGKVMVKIKNGYQWCHHKSKKQVFSTTLKQLVLQFLHK